MREITFQRCLGYVCVTIWLCRTCSTSAVVNERLGCREEWGTNSQCVAEHTSSLLQMKQFAPQSMEWAPVEDTDAVATPGAVGERQPVLTQYPMEKQLDAPDDLDMTEALSRLSSPSQYQMGTEKQSDGSVNVDTFRERGPSASQYDETTEQHAEATGNVGMHESAPVISESDGTQGHRNAELDESLNVEAQTSTADTQKSDGTVALGNCNPQCMWKCDSPKCDEICKPICKPPRCETRCEGVSLKDCVMDCNQPHCAVLCPERMCPNKPNQCKECKTTCSEAVCKLKCPSKQPCQNVCEHPQCEWSCAAPTKCPPPKCRMWCETPKSCRGSTYKQLPKLKPGESSVKAFSAAHRKQVLQPTDSLQEAPSVVQITSDASQASTSSHQEGGR